jgi:hypothetical protein
MLCHRKTDKVSVPSLYLLAIICGFDVMIVQNVAPQIKAIWADTQVNMVLALWLSWHTNLLPPIWKRLKLVPSGKTAIPFLITDSLEKDLLTASVASHQFSVDFSHHSTSAGC